MPRRLPMHILTTEKIKLVLSGVIDSSPVEEISTGLTVTGSSAKMPKLESALGEPSSWMRQHRMKTVNSAIPSNHSLEI